MISTDKVVMRVMKLDLVLEYVRVLLPVYKTTTCASLHPIPRAMPVLCCQLILS
jgi:hypothetical protein